MKTGNLKYSDLGMYIAILIITISLFFEPSDLVGRFVWISIMSLAGLLWIALAVFDYITKAKYLKTYVIPQKLILINRVVLDIFVSFFLFCLFYTFYNTLSPWMGYVYWFLLGAMITSRIMVGIDWRPRE